MDTLLNDIRIGLRRFSREPLFSLVAVLTLAIGIGANSAIFTLVNGVLLRPLPYQDADALVYAHATIRGEPVKASSSPVFLTLREQGTAFEGVALFTPHNATIAGEGEPEQIAGASVSANYFDVLGVAPLRGRQLRAEENEPGNDNVVLLSEGVWRDRFGADEAVLGRTVELNGRPFEVVGVMPAHASFPPEWRYWVPITFTEGFRDPENVMALGYGVVARMKPGVTMEQAAADVARAVATTKVAGAMDNPNYSGSAMPLQEVFVGDARTPLLVLLGAVGLVLLIVCANMANLLLAQAASRSADFAVRMSLGARPSQLVRQLMVESLVLGMIGGVAGLILGMWGAEAMVASLPPELPRMPGMRLDGNVVLFTMVVSLVASLAFGMAPALHARRAALALSLREGGRGLAGRAGGRTRAGLVLAETALAFSLVIGAGLLIRSFGELRTVNPGFDAENALSFRLSLPSVRYDSDERIVAFWDQLTERLEAVPGAERVGAIQHLPLGGAGMTITFEVEGREPPAPGEEQTLDVRIVTPGYFEAMGVPLVRGRLLTAQDRAGATRVALLSESAAARHFPNEDPVGRRIVMGWTSANGDTVQGEVVGVVGDVRHGQLRSVAEPEIYFPIAQVPRLAMSVTVRTAGSTEAVAGAITGAVHEIDPGLAVSQLRPLTEVVAASVATDLFMTRLLSTFSAVALLLAAIGIFGVISYGVAQRRREIGVRIAVGASRRDVLMLIVSGALRLAGGGILIGVVAALALSRLMRSLLFGVQPFDVATFASGAVVLMTVAFAASMLPALSAARTPPAAVLNRE
ncbi:MAG TPA: ABC transporter permease [Longimicrobiales bacterium]|nr:ABC transporter permease [Longimicrobiales bacterium]